MGIDRGIGAIATVSESMQPALHRGQHDDDCGRCKFYRQTGKVVVGALRFMLAELSTITAALERKLNSAAIDHEPDHADRV